MNPSSHQLSVQSRSPQGLVGPVKCAGVGLHTGILTQVKILPGVPGEGRCFVRVDLPDRPVIPATVDAVHQTTLSTELAIAETSVRTVEHLLAALMAMGVEDARIEVDGPELPLLDGSALPWVEAIAQVGLVPTTPKNQPEIFPLSLPISVYEGDAFVSAIPSPELRFSYGIDFPEPAIGNQWYSWSPSQSSFATEIAPARTFGLARQIEQLQAAGLIKGGTLENALVCGETGWINPPLRFPNEPARHKILDLVGDLSLLGPLPLAHFIAYKASHKLHIQLVRALAEHGSRFNEAGGAF
ncbi:UDP-3-O-acyl-N-acetylglucosamine deacetylase [Laspinema sp. A4]|uniref:UDP-3-O-acyl-N-acetylglucosamine deacetylase n=1 Tax=Laspinema sp. D2d TaxID=2953686 RepID=UPI0021BA6E29|nr:UDP-3-O-acyl-N-acetylglucosamine deacetylase [Laspinema sp. D2d]MCT7985189.1 UDP-3-O-acyl-N-acetylglucosamine deacetylase [Laspinema sp. D2d]